jgi:predicted transcriptional regulator
METKRRATVTVTTADQRAALTSPIRLEIIGLFTAPGPLAIADMAVRMGRPASSLYHHVGVLERTGILRKAGTRPKGKRFETLYEPAGERIEMEVEPDDARAADQAVRAMKAAFRMTVRDLEAALRDGNARREGPDRNVAAMRLHLRASPALRRELNAHLRAIEDLLAAEAARAPEPGPEDEHLSLTLALLPLRGRYAQRAGRKGNIP